MASPYQVGVDISIGGNAPQVLAMLSKTLLGLHGSVGQLTQGFAALRLGIVGAAMAMAGEKMFGVMGHIVDKGNALVKIQRDMAQAGATNVQVQEAYAKAWELTGKFQNIGAVEALKMMNDARQTFGDQASAIHHIDPFIRSASFLKAFEGNEKGGVHSAALMAEMNAAMKSGEIAGKIKPEDMDKHVAMLTAMKVAFGDQLKITQYLTAQRAAGVALRNADDQFRYGMFPALVQENGVNAGTMLMTLFNKVVAGTGNRTKSLEHMANMGLIIDPNMIEYAKSGHVKGLKDPDAIKANHDAAINFANWVFKTLKPLLDNQTKGLTGVDKSIRESQLISSIFPDRNAAKAATELLQQYTKLSKDAENIYKVKKDFETYTEGSWDYQVQAFHTQWDNFLEAFGAPMVGMATKALAEINRLMSGMAQWAADHPDAARVIGLTLSALGVGLAAIGTIAVGGAILSVVSGFGLLAGLPWVALAAGIIGLGYAIWKNWPEIKAYIASIPGRVYQSAVDTFTIIGNVVSDQIKRLKDVVVNELQHLWDAIVSALDPSRIAKSLGSHLPNMNPLTYWDQLFQKESFVGTPPSGDNVIHVKLDGKIDADGRQIARLVADYMTRDARFPTSVGGQDTRATWLYPGDRMAA